LPADEATQTSTYEPKVIIHSSAPPVDKARHQEGQEPSFVGMQNDLAFRLSKSPSDWIGFFIISAATSNETPDRRKKVLASSASGYEPFCAAEAGVG
jgi:hypothetical protein